MTNSRTKIRAALLVLNIFFLLLSSACSQRLPDGVSKSAFVLNTAAEITLYDGSDSALIDDCFALCRDYEALLSRTRSDSEISRLNSRSSSEVSPATVELLKAGLNYSALSGGALDITVEPVSSLWDFSSPEHRVPDADALAKAAAKVDYRAVSIQGESVSFSSPDTRLDLGAIAKGYIADKMKDFLVENGVTSAIINLGGNVLCIGGRSAQEGFRVAILRPFGSDSIATVEVSDGSVVTSGVYERCFEEDGVLYHHLLDTKTGYPLANGLLSVTIVSPRSTDGDALSTACFALGQEKGMELINSLDGVYAMFITDDYALHFSEGMEQAYKIEY